MDNILRKGPASNGLIAPLLATQSRPQHNEKSPLKGATSQWQHQMWHWAAYATVASLVLISALIFLASSLTPLPGGPLPRVPSLPSLSSPHMEWLRQAIPILGDQKRSSQWVSTTVSQMAAGLALHALQGIQVAASLLTRWAMEPLALLLLLDTVLLTAVGLTYQFTTKLGRHRSHSTSQQAKVHPVALSAAEEVGGVDQRSSSNGNRKRSKVVVVPEEAWPKVLVQLPMYNEREVYARAISSACQLAWPRSRLVIQVLDDSTEEDVSAGMRKVVEEWRQKGVDVRYRQRVDRKGYKAGNLREGLTEPYAKECVYVAVLDADFEPRPEWLLQATAPLEKDKTLALVQTRWTFSNEDECLVTKMQAIELTWHFWAEQLVSSLALRCFGFNGTAGVWRTEAIMDAGNWRDDTTVEDMDMAVCAAMRGWKMLMLPEVECLSEVPSSYLAYRKQQHRWTSGPASLLRQRFWSIACTPGRALGWGAKVYLVAVYMILRRSVRHLVGFAMWPLLSLWLLMPALCSAAHGLASVSHLNLPGGMCGLPIQHAGGLSGSSIPFPWMAVAFAALYPACLLCFSPKKLHLYPAYFCFLNGMLPARVYAVLAGLFDLKSSRTWDVTQKLGKKPQSCTGCATDSKPLSNSETKIVVSIDRMDKEEAALNTKVYCCSPVATEEIQQSRPRFQQETLMGKYLMLVAATATCIGVAFICLRDPREWLGGMDASIRAAVVLAIFLQGCWSLWIGGFRWTSVSMGLI